MENKYYNLTNPQNSIWLTEQMYSGTSIGNICGSVIIDEKVDFSILEKSINNFVKKNDSFRIKIKNTNDGIMQYISDFVPFALEIREMKSREEIADLEKELVSKPFTLIDSPLFKFVAFKFDDCTGGFIMNAHHLIVDAWTVGITLNGIIEHYEYFSGMRSEIPEKYPSYVDYINSEKEYINSEKYNKDKEYWNKMFETIPEVAKIPGSNQSDINKIDCSSNRQTFTLSRELTDSVNLYCKENNSSAFNFFMALFSLYLSNITNKDELVVGSPILNRGNIKDKNTTGMFISTVPFKVAINFDEKFTSLMSKISSNFMQVFRHQKYPYQHLLESLRATNSSIPNLYNYILSYQNIRSDKQSAKIKFHTRWIQNGCISDDMDIHLYDMDDTGNLQIIYDYLANKYSNEDIKSLNNRILYMTNQIINNQDILIKDIEIVTPQEKELMLKNLNGDNVDYPKDKTITKLFEEQVQKTPNNIAVKIGDKSITYNELNIKANQLAHFLVKKGVKQGDIVALRLDRSLEMIVSIIAIIKAGACYLPINLAYPNDRVNFMLSDSNAKFLLCDTATESQINTNVQKFFVDFDNSQIYADNTCNLNVKISPEDLLYIIYTSGSTGTPKGAMISHKNVVRLMKNDAFLFDFNETDVWTMFHAVSFDFSVWEMYGALLYGGKLVLIPDMIAKDPSVYLKLLRDEQVTVLNQTPTYFYNLLNNELKFNDDNLKIRYIIYGGEALKPTVVAKWKEKYPNCKLINMYGITETTVHVTFKELLAGDLKLPTSNIGKPIPTLSIMLLNKHLKLVPKGVQGEICVLGDGVFKGYLNRPDLNETKLVPNPYNTAELMYRSGDSAILRDNYELEYTGRIDTQVKIRGFRVELGEIEEKILKSNNNIKSCVVTTKNLDGSHDLLCAYYVKNGNVDIQSLRLSLSKSLPNYMIPQYFIELQSLPYNYNGKIDKKALPNPEVSTNKDVIPPRNIIDEKLTKIFKEILNVNVISIEDSFFELGGDSLEAINLCSKIYSEFGVEVFVKNIYECSIVRELSDFISLSDVKKNAKISKTEERDFYPLSSAQQRIYYATSMAGDSSLLYNISGGLILDKLPDLVKLQKSFDDVISMQPSLRTCFVLHGNDVVQKINKKINFKLDVNEEVIDENRLDFVFDDFVKPFDLSHAPLFRAKIYKLSSGKVLLAIDTHHIISDGASLSALIKDICKSYNGQSLTKLQLDYKDYTVWENNNLNSGKFNEAEAYWLNQFKYDVPLLNLPTKPRETTSSYDGNVIKMSLNKFQVQKIVDLSKKLEVTPYMLMLAAYYILLYKYTSQNDIVVGTPIVNRNTSELYDIIGMFVNSLPMRINIDGELRFKELLTNIKELSLENYKYQYYPFDQLVKKLKITRAVNRNPLFDTMFIYQNNGYADVTLDGINAKYYIPKSKISKFDLSLEVLPIDEEMKLSFEYKKALFSEDFITKLSCHYAKILDTVLDNVNIKIAKINMLSNTERNQIIDEFNNTKTVYPLNKTIIKLFDEQVEKTPNNIAISFEDKTLTFAKLSELASKYAFYLKNNGVIEKDVVAIMCKRSIYLPAYILAVLKLGAAYLLIDPSLPKERIQYMINNCKAKKLIVDNEYDIKFSSFVFVNEMNKETVLLNNHQLNTVPTDVFAIIYTSGSTGMPKGVMLTNQGFVNLVYSFCDIMDIHTFKNQIGLASVSFDMFAVELFSCVLLGRTLYLLNEEELKNPMLISKKIINNNIEFIITTPTKIDLLTSTEEISTCLKHIKALQLGGEILTTTLVEKLRHYTDAKIYNGYGPTEISACCSNKYIEHDNVINIGKPNPNVHIYIVDKDQNLCPIGVPGQLCVSGLGLSAGYVNAPEKTVLSFVKSNFNDEILYKTGDIAKYTENGELEYIGRNDFQIKINGLRIEISEVETQLAAVKEIKSCVVLPDNSKKYLKAFYVSDENLHVPNIKKSLAEKLPYYMIPKYIFKLDSIPMTTNGKIDVTFLRNYKESECNSNVSYVAPETDLQKNLCQIWSNILDSKVGIDNDVFELGADSLLAIRFKVQALNINIDIPYADIFKYKTVRELSSSIEGSIRNKTPIEKYDYTQINNVLKENKIKLNYKINFCRNNNVLLLGSNGFVGMHIIDSFIRQDTGKIYCLMRKKNGEEANSRFMNVLHFYFGENLDKEVGNRIIIVEGDATKDDFGLNKTDYQSVIENVSVVINSAANVKHYGDFDKFKDINIGAISKAILFCRQHSKRFIHLSTLSISGNMFLDGTVSNNSSSSKIYFSEKDLYINQTLDNIYTRSKFEAERIILDEISNGLDALILRLGNITSRFSDGKFQFNPGENAFAVRFQSFLAVGAIPKSLLRQEIEFTPVDLCANAIVKCIQNRAKDISVLHIYDKKHVKVNKIYKVLKNMGFNIKVLSNQDFSKFIQKSLNDSIMQNNLMGLINDITKDKTISYASNIRIKSKFTIHFLLHCKFKWPKLNKKYIEKYIIYLRKINFINF